MITTMVAVIITIITIIIITASSACASVLRIATVRPVCAGDIGRRRIEVEAKRAESWVRQQMHGMVVMPARVGVIKEHNESNAACARVFAGSAVLPLQHALHCITVNGVYVCVCMCVYVCVCVCCL